MKAVTKKKSRGEYGLEGEERDELLEVRLVELSQCQH